MLKHKFLNNVLVLMLFAAASAVSITSCTTDVRDHATYVVHSSFEMYSASDIIYIEFDSLGWTISTEYAGIVGVCTSLNDAVHRVEQISHVDIPYEIERRADELGGEYSEYYPAYINDLYRELADFI